MSAQELDILADSPIDIMIAEETAAFLVKKQRWNVARTHFAAPLNALLQIGVEPRFDSHDCNVYVSGDKLKLTAIVRIFRTCGFALVGDERPKPGDTSWSGYFKHPNSEQKFYLHFTSTVCKRVKVGTKTVEQDIYETRCGDDLVGAELDAPASTPQITEEIPF